MMSVLLGRPTHCIFLHAVPTDFFERRLTLPPASTLALILLYTSKGHRKQNGDRSECTPFLIVIFQPWREKGIMNTGILSEMGSVIIQSRSRSRGFKRGINCFFFSHFLQISLELQENSVSSRVRGAETNSRGGLGTLGLAVIGGR